MYVRGDQWPLFLYQDNKFDAESPWEGLMRNQLLVSVRCNLMPSTGGALINGTGLQACPDRDDAKATRSGNTHIRGMTSATAGSLAYAATQVSRTLIDTDRSLTDVFS